MSPNIFMLHARSFIAFTFGAFLLTSASAEPSGPGFAKRPPAHLKSDQVNPVTGSKRTLAAGKIESPNARVKAGDAGYWELGEDGAKAPRAKTTKTRSGGDEAGTLKGLRTNPEPRSPNAGNGAQAVVDGGSLPKRKATAQYNPKELGVDKRN